MPFQAASPHGRRRCGRLAGRRAFRRAPLPSGCPRLSWTGRRRGTPPLLLALVSGSLIAVGLGLDRGALAGATGHAAPPARTGAPAASPNQPFAIDAPGLLPPPCPLIVPPELPALQPVRIQPSQVAAKNRMGCLSPADAIYGPDGCPLKLCAPTSGSFPAGRPR